MTNKDARTPASSQDPTETSVNGETGKSIGWHKAYVEGSRPDLRVPVRQVHLTNGQSVTLYDTSGPYTDPLVGTDVRRGLAPLRENWIVARGDTEEYAGRPVRPEDDAWDPVVTELHAKRLNPPDGEAQPQRWARESRVLRLEPTGRMLERPGHLSHRSHAAEPPGSPATTRGPLPFVIGRRARRRR